MLTLAMLPLPSLPVLPASPAEPHAAMAGLTAGISAGSWPLPLDLAATALLVLGLALLLTEAFAPSFGVLGIGGVLALVAGVGLLLDEGASPEAMSWPLAGGLALAALGCGVLALRVAWRTRGRRALTGADALPGAIGHVLDWSAADAAAPDAGSGTGSGHVHVQGERWQARGPARLVRGEPIRVRAVQGLSLDVEAAGGTGATQAAPESSP